jgi:hypothetical protein
MVVFDRKNIDTTTVFLLTEEISADSKCWLAAVNTKAQQSRLRP